MIRRQEPRKTISKGGGLIGVTRQFLYAGSRRVLATLWEIDDRTAAEFMKRFCEGMMGRGQKLALQGEWR